MASGRGQEIRRFGSFHFTWAGPPLPGGFPLFSIDGAAWAQDSSKNKEAGYDVDCRLAVTKKKKKKKVLYDDCILPNNCKISQTTCLCSHLVAMDGWKSANISFF